MVWLSDPGNKFEDVNTCSEHRQYLSVTSRDKNPAGATRPLVVCVYNYI